MNKDQKDEFTVNDLIEKLVKKMYGFCKDKKHLISEGIALIPKAGVVQEYLSDVSRFCNDLKLEYAWYCISGGKNIEASINELYNYVSDEERAFYISNEFKKIILATSVLSSSIIAYIMGNVVRDKRKCTHEEIILTNALTKMSDYDLDNFIYLCAECVENLAGREVVQISKCNCDMSSCYYTLQLCAGSGLFAMESDLMGEDLDDLESESSIIQSYVGLHYLKNEYSEKLLDYIGEVRQLLDYSRD